MKQPQLNVKSDMLEDCIWMSYRYCVGSHTIATHMHAADIAECLRDNPGFLTPARRAFMGRDIRGEINHHMGWLDNVSVDGFQTHYDALSLVLNCCIERGIKPSEFNNWKFYANAERGLCEAEPYEGRTDAGLMDIEDMMVWVKLAGYLDPSERIEWRYEGRTDAADGFAYYDIDRSEDKFEIRHVTAGIYAEHPSRDVSIQDKYITSITKI